VLWQIQSPLAFRRSFPNGTTEAKKRIQRTVGSLVGDAVGNLSMAEVLARAEILETLDERATEELESNGIRVVDVRINRTELPLPSESATFEQMREQRRAISRRKRAVGAREAREIRAKANREAREMLAQANADSEIRRGEGDAEAARIYAEAYSKDPDFYAFVRSLEAYRKTLAEGTTLVVAPDHEFFKYLDPKPGGAN
jgi:membrane protease subunit HflC